MLYNMNPVCDMDMMEPLHKEPLVTVVEGTPEHVRILGSNQRERDILIAGRVGIPAHVALWRAYKQSLIRRSVLVEGKVVAMFGVTGTFLGKKGRPWFVASPFVEDYPIKLAFRYRTEVKNMLKLFPILEDLVCVDDEKTTRLLEILGFKFGLPQSFNKIMFMKATLER